MLPPVVTGAVVLLIGLNLAPVVANTYWPQDQWTALAVMVLVIALSVGLRGFIGRVAIFLALVLGFVLGRLMEENLRRALVISRGDLMVFLERPISAALLALALILLVLALLPSIRRGRDEVFTE